MANITFSEGSGVNDSIFGSSQTAVRMLIEKRGEQFERESIVNRVFKKDKTDHWAEKYTSLTAMEGFQVAGENGAYPTDGQEEGFSKVLEAVTWKDSFSLSREIVEDSKTIDLRKKPAGFVTAYYRTREKLGAALLGGAISGSSSVSYAGGRFDLKTSDGQTLFHAAHPAKIKGDAQCNLFSDAFSADALGMLEVKMQNTRGDNDEILEENAGPVLPPYYDEAVMAHGEGWTENPPYFLTAYGLAVRGGYGGTAEEWIASLKGETGESAYDLAREAGYEGTEEELAQALTDLLDYARTAEEAKAAAVAAAARAEAAADGMVPQTRKINGHDLSRDRSLSAADLGLGNVANERQYSAVNPPPLPTPAQIGAATPVRTGSVALSAQWTGDGPYTQTVTVTGAAVTAKSKVDLQPSAAQLAALIADGVGALVVENDAGTLTAYALGTAPSAAMTVQCTVEETA